MKELSNSVCIVGVDESDEIGSLPNISQLSLHLQATHNAIADAGLKISDIDGIPAGVSAGIPFLPNVSTMEPIAARPISTTRVPPVLARTSQGTDESGLVGSSLPLTTVKDVAMPR